MIAARQFCRAAPQFQRVRPFLNNNLPGTKPRTARLTLRLLIALQNVRRYATEGSPSGGMNRWVKWGGVAFGTTFVADRSVWSYHRLPDCEQHNSSLSRDECTFSISGPLYFVKRAAAIGQLNIPSGGMNRWVKWGGVAFGTIFVGFGVARALVRKPDPNSEEDRRAYEELTGKKLGHTSDKPAQKTFKGGDQGWLDLKLESVEQINHNTKKLRFALPDKDDVSGLQVACT